MLMFKFLRFPNFKGKAVTLSYDDGVIYDRPLIEILNKYGLKCTFNVNTGMFRDEFPDQKRLSKAEATELFSAHPEHEVALHGHKHLSLANCSEKDGIIDIVDNRRILETMFNRLVRGMAYANASFDDRVVKYLKELDICYSRTTDATHEFKMPREWLKWNPTCHHNDEKLFDLVAEFNAIQYNNTFADPILFYLWGHSYEFHDFDNWDRIEKFCKEIGGKDDVWYCTNIELYNYTQAYNSLVWSADNKIIYNPSLFDVYLQIDCIPVKVKSGETVFFKNEPIY